MYSIHRRFYAARLSFHTPYPTQASTTLATAHLGVVLSVLESATPRTWITPCFAASYWFVGQERSCRGGNSARYPRMSATSSCVTTTWQTLGATRG